MSLKQLDLGEGAWLHRHAGVHRSGDDHGTCWCCPVWIDEDWQLTHSRREIAEFLTSFYAVQ